MFAGKCDNGELRRLGNGCTLELWETAEAAFVYHGRNRHSFQRIFAVLTEGATPSRIVNHTGGEGFRMRAGALYFMPAETDLEFVFAPGLRFLSIHFNLKLFCGMELFAGETRCREKTDEEAAIEALARCVRRSPPTPREAVGIQAFLWPRLLEWLPEREDGWEEARGRYAAVFEYIERFADARTSIDDLVACTPWSRDRLSRGFSRDCGIALKTYLERALVARAEKLLLNPKSRIRDVAEQLRFNDEYYFSRFFKRHTGIAPGEYRRLRGVV